MPNDRNIEDYERILVVEGYNDLLFYAEILEEIGSDKDIFIKEMNGTAGLKLKLETFINPGLLQSKKARPLQKAV